MTAQIFVTYTQFCQNIISDGRLSALQLSWHDFKLGLQFSYYKHIMGVIKPLMIHDPHVNLLCLLHAE